MTTETEKSPSSNLKQAIEQMNAIPDISGNDSPDLRRFCAQTAREIKAVGGVSASTSLEMIGYMREMERRNQTQAESIMEFQAEQKALLSALRSVPLLVEAAKGILNVHTWRGKKGYEAALRDGINELRAALSGVPDVAGMLLELNSLTPKGEQQL